VELKERIESALKEAIRNKDSVAKNALRGLLTALKNKEKELRRELDEQEVLRVISSQVKQRKDSIEQFKSGGREDLAEKEQAEIAVLEQFLPKALSDDELLALVDECIKEAGAMTVKDLGKVMKIIMPKVAGRADGKRVNELVRTRLQGS